MAELTQEKLEEMVVGKKHPADAVFYEKAALNVEKSRESGRRIYDKVVYIKKTQPGVTDWIASRAKKADIKRYPEEYEYFLNNKQGDREVPVNIIPGLDIAHLQELIDRGITTIPQLAKEWDIPDHLAYAQKAAIVFNDIIEETRNGKEEDTSKGEGNPEGFAGVINEATQKASNGSPSDRQDNGLHERQPGIPASSGEQDHAAGKGLQAGGQFDYSKGLNANYSIEVNIT